jgi:hypothetical protein
MTISGVTLLTIDGTRLPMTYRPAIRLSANATTAAL